jgi:hypothetical protein
MSKMSMITSSTGAREGPHLQLPRSTQLSMSVIHQRASVVKVMCAIITRNRGSACSDHEDKQMFVICSKRPQQCTPITWTFILAGGVMNIEDAYCNPLFSPDVDVRLGYRTHSILCCSIADMSGKNIAVLQVRLFL